MEFKGNNVSVKKDEKEEIDEEALEEKQYNVTLRRKRKKQANLTDPTLSGAMEWHRKLENISKDRMMRIDLIEGMRLNKEDLKKCSWSCDTCYKAKQTREEFQQSGSELRDHWR